MSNVIVIGLIFLGILLLLYLIGIPVAIAMGVSSVFMMVLPVGPDLNFRVISTQLLFGLNSFSLLAIPFYLFLGRIMNRLDITDRIFEFADSIVGQFTGGIAQVNIIASIIFSGMSGLATADAAGLGRIEFQAMRDQGYSKEFATGVTGASSIIGPIIPPSVTLIIFGVLADVSIGDLFLAGILPGILLGITLMLFSFIYLSIKGDPSSKTEFKLERVWNAFKSAFPALLLPAFIIGGILGGLFTATEAGAAGVVYSLGLGVWYKTITWEILYEELRDSMVETFALTFILSIATLFAYVTIQLQLPQLVAEFLTSITQNQIGILIILSIMLLVIGAFLEMLAALIILVPIVSPVIQQVGIDPLQFGVIMVLVLMVGLITPPYGLILFILERVTTANLNEIVRGVSWFYIPILLVILILIFVPELMTFIPREIAS